MSYLEVTSSKSVDHRNVNRTVSVDNQGIYNLYLNNASDSATKQDYTDPKLIKSKVDFTREWKDAFDKDLVKFLIKTDFIIRDVSFDIVRDHVYVTDKRRRASEKYEDYGYANVMIDKRYARSDDFQLSRDKSIIVRYMVEKNKKGLAFLFSVIYEHPTVHYLYKSTTDRNNESEMIMRDNRGDFFRPIDGAMITVMKLDGVIHYATTKFMDSEYSSALLAPRFADKMKALINFDLFGNEDTYSYALAFQLVCPQTFINKQIFAYDTEGLLIYKEKMELRVEGSDNFNIDMSGIPTLKISYSRTDEIVINNIPGVNLYLTDYIGEDFSRDLASRLLLGEKDAFLIYKEQDYSIKDIRGNHQCGYMNMLKLWMDKVTLTDRSGVGQMINIIKEDQYSHSEVLPKNEDRKIVIGSYYDRNYLQEKSIEIVYKIVMKTITRERQDAYKVYFGRVTSALYDLYNIYLLNDKNLIDKLINEVYYVNDYLNYERLYNTPLEPRSINVRESNDKKYMVVPKESMYESNQPKIGELEDALRYDDATDVGKYILNKYKDTRIVKADFVKLITSIPYNKNASFMEFIKEIQNTPEHFKTQNSKIHNVIASMLNYPIEMRFE